MNFEIKIYTDGGSRGNPGPSAAGWVVLSQGNILTKGSKNLGVGTNNQAEYKGVIQALDWLIKNKGSLQVKKINFFLDSELVVRQLNGEYRIRDTELKNLSRKIINLQNILGVGVIYESILREKNRLADKLVNERLDMQKDKTSGKTSGT